MTTRRLTADFYQNDALSVARSLCGMILCVRQVDGSILKKRITETECYLGENDTACHAHHGRTARTDVMYKKGGVAYVYLCYGMHNMLNIVTGPENHPQAVLIRGVAGFPGPGRVTKAMGISRDLNAVSFTESDLIWLEDDGTRPQIKTTPRIGITYASEEDKARLWRFVVI